MHIRKWIAAVMLAGMTALPAAADTVWRAGVGLPRELTVADTPLRLAGCGLREVLFTDVYVIALYLPHAGMDRATILSPDTAKAVRVHIVYDGEMPDEMPDEWQASLREIADDGVRDALAELYARFRAGDEVGLDYAPAHGATFSINGDVVRRGPDDALIRPLMRLWIGDAAVEPCLRRALLSGTCREPDDGLL